MDAPFRMYVKDGCPACKEAIDFMTKLRVPCEWIDIGNDPVLNSGVMARGGKVPILVSFSTTKRKLVKGFEPETYMELVTDYFTRKDGDFEEVEVKQPQQEPVDG